MRQTVIPTFNKWGAGIGMLYSPALQGMLENYATNHAAQIGNIEYPYPSPETGGYVFNHATYGGGAGWRAKLKPTIYPLITGALSPNSVIRPFKDDSNAMCYVWWVYSDNTGGATVGKKVGWCMGLAAAKPTFNLDLSFNPVGGSFLFPYSVLPTIEQKDVTFDAQGMPLWGHGLTEGKYEQLAVGFEAVHPEKYKLEIHRTPLYSLRTNGASVLRDPNFSFRHVPCDENAPPVLSVATWRMSAGAAASGMFANGAFDWDGDGSKDSDDCEDKVIMLGVEAKFF
jgi:hypothetical protein